MQRPAMGRARGVGRARIARHRAGASNTLVACLALAAIEVVVLRSASASPGDARSGAIGGLRLAQSFAPPEARGDEADVRLHKIDPIDLEPARVRRDDRPDGGEPSDQGAGAPCVDEPGGDTCAPTPGDGAQDSASDALASRPAAIAGQVRHEAASPRARAPGPWIAGGFVDTNYGFNSNSPANHVNRGTATQPRTGEFTVNLVGLWLSHEATPGRLSWTMDVGVQAGPAADALVAAEPRAGGENAAFSGAEVFKHIPRASAGIVGRRGTSLTAGLMTSPIGFGVHWIPYNWNYTVTWQLNGAPYYMAGARLEQLVGRAKRHTLGLWVVNGWQLASENNAAPSAMLHWTFRATSALNVVYNLWLGPEQDALRLRHWRLLSDTQVIWERPRAGLGVVFDVGTERSADTADPGRRLWVVGAVFSRLRVFESRAGETLAGTRRPDLVWDLALRPEFFWDRDGTIYGVDQTLLAGTFTSAWRILGHVLIRAEYRYDHSLSRTGFFLLRESTAPWSTPLAINQHTVFVSLAALFDHRFGDARRGRPRRVRRG